MKLIFPFIASSLTSVIRTMAVLFAASFFLSTTNAAVVQTVGDALRQEDAWFKSDEGRQALANILSHQSAYGDWPKNTKTLSAPSPIRAEVIRGTFDNGATTGEMRILARAFTVTGRPAYRDAFNRALDHIFEAQYANGGWPQYAPPPTNSYHRRITFNDGAMLHILELLRDINASSTNTSFAFIDDAKRSAAHRALERGIDCLLKCQIRFKGEPAVWCAQHDEITLKPRPGRSYELESFSGSESAGVLLFLMTIEKPSAEIIRSVQGGVRWFEQSRMTGLREVKVDGDKKLVRDEKAPPLWARFYDLETNRPFYCGRNGVKRFDFAAIEPERRNGYAWHGAWGEPVLRRFEDWQKKLTPAKQ